MPAAELILLVNDIPDHITRYREALADHGFRVELARTGQDALDLVRHSLPDCAIIDLRLPDMSGWDLCHRIKSAEREAIRVIVLTPEVSQMCASDSSKAGCNAWLSHPTSPEILVETVKQILDMDTDAPISAEDALIGIKVCAGCGSDQVMARVRVGSSQYYCCKVCRFCWRVDTFTSPR